MPTPPLNTMPADLADAEIPLRTLMDLYNRRPDLQNAFPEVLVGEYTRLIKWAAAVISGQTVDSSLAELQSHAELHAKRSPDGSARSLVHACSAKETSGHPTWQGVIPLPADSLIRATGLPNLESFLVAGDAWFQVMSPHLAPASTILDIGCGCGRLARFLVRNALISRYIGFDVIPENIEWVNRFIAPLSSGKAEFLHYDLYSAEYNPGGQLRVTDFRFPCDDRSVDLAIASSVFTHLLEADAVHYLRETGRVLRSGGKAIVSIHAADNGKNFSGNEARIDINPECFLDLAAAAGLLEVDRMNDLCGQQVFVLGKI